MLKQSIHLIEKIEIIRTYNENGNMRTVRFTTSFGDYEIDFYGETGALDTLPRSDYCVDVVNPEAA